MRAFVVIATKGRATETKRLLDYLERQTRRADFVVIAGTEAADLEGLGSHQLIASGQGLAVVSPKIGSAAQRNFGLEVLEGRGLLGAEQGSYFCAFFDDDYRPAVTWLERAGWRLDQGGAVGLTGKILADGVKRGGVAEEEAAEFLDGSRPPEHHWASGDKERDTGAVYGCNMAFVDEVVREIRFDENLPLYGWQEDRDYTSLARSKGRVIYFPECRGVHLGVRRGRTSGVRFGYSQIANPLYLMRKGTMDRQMALKFMARALAANLARSMATNALVDYRGRLRGNFRAMLDVISARVHPCRIVDGEF